MAKLMKESKCYTEAHVLVGNVIFTLLTWKTHAKIARNKVKKVKISMYVDWEGSAVFLLPTYFTTHCKKYLVLTADLP